MVVETQKQNMATLASSGVELIGHLLVLLGTAAASNSPNIKNYLYKAIPVDHGSILSSLQDFGKVRCVKGLELLSSFVNLYSYF